MDVNLIVEHQPETTIAFQDSDPTMPAEIDTKEVTDEQQTDAALLNLAPEVRRQSQVSNLCLTDIMHLITLSFYIVSSSRAERKI